MRMDGNRKERDGRYGGRKRLTEREASETV